jgi:hypothetical protein
MLDGFLFLILQQGPHMGFGDRISRMAGWTCLALVAALTSMGYHFGNVRFAPVALGFAILAAVFLMDSSSEQVKSNAIHPGPDSRVGRASGGRELASPHPAP